MAQAKYIIVEEKGLELPIIFNSILTHADVAGNKKVISAGFCQSDYEGVYSVWGESVSLKIKSRPQDCGILTRDLEKDF
jgi:hypothetical protein